MRQVSVSDAKRNCNVESQPAPTLQRPNLRFSFCSLHRPPPQAFPCAKCDARDGRIFDMRTGAIKRQITLPRHLSHPHPRLTFDMIALLVFCLLSYFLKLALAAPPFTLPLINLSYINKTLPSSSTPPK